MPAPSTAVVRTEAYKKLIRERCPEFLKTPEGQVFSSIIVSLSERMDRLEAENLFLKKTQRALAMMVHELAGGDDGEESAEGGETIEGDDGGEGTGSTSAATGTAGGRGGGSVQAPQRKQDATPFPAGVPSSKAEAAAMGSTPPAANAAPVGGPPVAAAAGPANKTGPMDDDGGEDLTPNAGGGPAVNAQPIPKNPNGRRPGANA